ncbi:clathrin heavy chain 1-like [Rhinatrema bivittatum]|uniref:clathrin heavy chain 1-like n=1 Tax=Rhinatrema bivittatum TaxID=194408 RepID=UPI00112E2433|nr:clathrin heavy chain 1-like [Rhinatrema bivittatum]XP_029462942.1 clathrin heavy chain 1-like [Rhinatrema bivittatum]
MSSLVQVVQLAQLQDYGIASDQITFPRVTLSSDSRLCVRHNTHDPSKARATLVNPRQPSSVCSWPINDAESALMSPDSPLLALRVGKVAEVYNVEEKVRHSQYEFSKQVDFWAWINGKMLAVVTEADVYHWNMRGSKPRHVFARDPQLQGMEIVGYHHDASKLWLALSGLALNQKGHIVGMTQLYSRSGQLGQVIQAQAVALPQYTFSRNLHPSSVLVAAVRSRAKEMSGQLHVVELGPHKAGNTALCNSRGSLPFNSCQPGDFPSAVQISSHLGLVLVLTKHGFLFLSDIETAQLVQSVQVTKDIVFATVPASREQGIVGVCRNGKVLSISVCEKMLYQFLVCRTMSLYVTQRLLQVVWKPSYKVTSV